jgi:D-alanine-D-alanine ligase-like ATP-grasp enzyme
VNEYRVIVLNSRCLLVYRKVRPTTIGDGHSSRMELLTHELGKALDGVTASKVLSELARQKCDLSAIVPKGQAWNINWKHNLGLGAKVELIAPSSPIRPTLENLALRAAAALSLTFGAVDLVETAQPNEMKILELNAGVMMESFITLIPEGRGIALDVYRNAVDEMFT